MYQIDVTPIGATDILSQSNNSNQKLSINVIAFQQLFDNTPN